MSRNSKRQHRERMKKLAAETTRIALRSPYADDLGRLVDRAYAAFGVDCVSPFLEVCQCPVCMTETVRQEIIATPNRLLESRLICEYSNSAHAPSTDTADLRLLLPRYMELIAQGEQVCWMDSDEVLWRFGAARVRQNFLSAGESDLVDDWGRTLILHSAWVEATDQDELAFMWGAVRLALSFGFDGDTVIAAMEETFSQPETGLAAFACFATHMKNRGHGPLGEFIYRDGPRPGAVEAVTDWINGERFAAWRARAEAAAASGVRFPCDDWGR